eukprot:m.712494 g.712494  ORF g.712494 m.712494 type:complete len:171 (+) comp58775_c1_seq37:737-1249(+)
MSNGADCTLACRCSGYLLLHFEESHSSQYCPNERQATPLFGRSHLGHPAGNRTDASGASAPISRKITLGGEMESGSMSSSANVSPSVSKNIDAFCAFRVNCTCERGQSILIALFQFRGKFREVEHPPQHCSTPTSGRQMKESLTMEGASGRIGISFDKHVEAFKMSSSDC